MHSIKVTIAFALIAAVSAGSHSYVKRTDANGIGYESTGYGSEGGLGFYGGEYKDFHHYPKYKYEYGVKDPKTGDHKSAWEHREGDKVVGGYTLDESDGTKRVVSYHADGNTGFHAIVKKIGHAHHHYNNDGGYGQGGSY